MERPIIDSQKAKARLVAAEERVVGTTFRDFLLRNSTDPIQTEIIARMAEKQGLRLDTKITTEMANKAVAGMFDFLLEKNLTKVPPFTDSV